MTITNLNIYTGIGKISSPYMRSVSDAIEESLHGSCVDFETIETIKTWEDAEERLSGLKTTISNDHSSIRSTWYQIEEVEVDEDGSYVDTIREDSTVTPSAVVIDDDIYRKRPYGWSYSGPWSDAEDIADRLRASGSWDDENQMVLAASLCDLAGLDDGWDAAGEDFERVVEKAADLLHVEIY